VLKWLNVDAEESVSQFDVLSPDVISLSEQQTACDKLHSVAKVMCVLW